MGRLLFEKKLSGSKPRLEYDIIRSKDELLLGFEYEIDRADDTQPKVPARYHARFEHIANPCTYGWEFKSPVAPLSYHKQTVRNFLGKVEFNREPNGIRNQGGIHVNVSKEGVTGSTYQKVKGFLFDRNLRDTFLKISKRDAGQFDQYCTQRDHWYYGVITDRKEYAYEFRMFAALPDLLLPALEMTDSLFELSRQTERVTLDSWIGFVAGKKRYENIEREIKVL